MSLYIGRREVDVAVMGAIGPVTVFRDIVGAARVTTAQRQASRVSNAHDDEAMSMAAGGGREGGS